MKKVILAVLVILLFVAGFALWYKRPVPAAVQLKLSGTPGLKVAGTVMVDGAPQEFSGVLPTNITAQARSFDYTIWMREPRGELRGELTVAGVLFGSSSTADDFSGVKGGYAHTWLGRGGMMTTAGTGE